MDYIEEWRTVIIDGIEFEDYEVSNLGNLRSIKSGLNIKGSLDSKGYVRVTLLRKENGKKIRKGGKIHRIVLESFEIPKPDGCDQVDHIDGDKENNQLTNLEWVDCKTNIKRSWETGLHSKDIRYGEHAGNSKYTTEQIETACQMKEDGWSTTQISKKLGIPLSTLSKIFTGKQWVNISSKYNI